MAIRCLNEAHGDRFALYNGDCVDVLRQMPSECIDFSVYSPPFGSLFVYSDSAADMGNSTDDEFRAHYAYLIAEKFRLTKPGRLTAVHCSDLPMTKWKDGAIGIKDFSGDIIRMHEAAGWIEHSRRTIWKCPVVEMTRTKHVGLLYKQLRKDSAKSRGGLADYLITFVKPGENADPIPHASGDEIAEIVRLAQEVRGRALIKGVDISLDRVAELVKFPLEQWQEWASPVWMTIDQSNVLNVKLAKEAADERHLCPLQLDVIERAAIMWSNPGDTILSPFAGIGSEGYVALQQGRKFIGVELKEAYWKRAARTLDAEDRQSSMLMAPAATNPTTPYPIPADPLEIPDWVNERTAVA